MNFSELGLSPQIIDAINKANYEKPYPIQLAAIPAILQRRDLLGIAQTGSGKTASYILPILETLQQTAINKGRSIPILIIVPTRELAAQVEEVIRTFSQFLSRKVKSQAVFGGVSINPQMMKLNGTDILVATPGRLLDLLSKNAISISDLQTLVLDEADKVLNLGFKEEVDEILSRLPKNRQNILFSATKEEAIEGLIAKLLKNPIKIEIKPEEITPDLIDQSAYLVSQEKKGPLLRYLIEEGNWQQVLVFTSSIRTADNLTAKLIKNGIQAMAFHGDKSQGGRTEALKQFKNGTLRVLVATDLAARGIDIKFLPYVVNYELPRSPKDYIHRIGRTGRAGSEGKAISLITEEDRHHFKVIQKKMKRWVELIDAENIL
ncbi:DNA/RNA helicase, superfamily II [Belliella baltica DSM 15883]|uniref:DNA/RNA helicase, superfamily II n=1 Tax=Belliella baltica (strain DSM 15883 / CIP 108006 / LMG 21964 / BA134) TaxID=866536 RepID=I3Z597_BELBD|nr:DEAD/DEAH box helicase [Belliella baltica]AFL84415.1 DNA/RNA helicase, superfamily II [Belliella baltica DSM 15883]